MNRASSKRETVILEFLKGYEKAHGYPATLREIASGTGITSTSVVSYYLDKLEKAGKISRTSGLARSIVVLNGDGASKDWKPMGRLPHHNCVAAVRTATGEFDFEFSIVEFHDGAWSLPATFPVAYSEYTVLEQLS